MQKVFKSSLHELQANVNTNHKTQCVLCAASVIVCCLCLLCAASVIQCVLFLSPGIVDWLQALLHWCDNNAVFIIDVAKVWANSRPQKI